MKTDDPPGAVPIGVPNEAADAADSGPAEGEQFLLQLEDVHTYFRRPGGLTRRAGAVRAVDGVSLAVRPGETVGLVGESGCGKTTLGRTIVRLEKATSGRILFEGQDLTRLSGADLKGVRSRIQMIFQDPRGSLDPQMRVAEIISEGIGAQSRAERAARSERVADILQHVGLSRDHLRRYPHEFSGGQLQRIGIARALIRRPRLIVADEAVSALDVSVQSQILNLMVDLQAELGLSYVFISHDLSVVEYMSDRVGVMYLGKIVELGSAADIYARPLMPYTQALLSATPQVDGSGRERIVLSGDVPSPMNPPSGCAFRTRCWMARDICATTVPPLEEVEPGHWSACHFSGETRQRQETR